MPLTVNKKIIKNLDSFKKSFDPLLDIVMWAVFCAEQKNATFLILFKVI